MKIARYVVIGLVLVALVMPLNMVLAQDDDSGDYGDDEPEPPDEFEMGVAGIAQATDDFDVPAQPTPAAAQAVVNATPALPAFLANYKPQSVQVKGINYIVLQNPMKFQMPPRQKIQPQSDCGDVLFEMVDNSDTSITLTTYADNCVVVVDSQQVTIFTGYFGYLADQRVVLVLTDTEGNQYAVYNDHMIGLTAGGDVLIGTNSVIYVYDYDEKGNFLGLTDSEGNDYELSVNDEGNISITDADGNTGKFDADGTYTIFDDSGNILDEGELFGDDEADEEADSFDDGYGDDGYGYGDDSGDDGYGDDDGYSDDSYGDDGYGYGNDDSNGDDGGGDSGYDD